MTFIIIFRLIFPIRPSPSPFPFRSHIKEDEIYQRRVRQNRLDQEQAATRRENDYLLKNVHDQKVRDKIAEKRQKSGKEPFKPSFNGERVKSESTVRKENGKKLEKIGAKQGGDKKKGGLSASLMANF